jgi:hypothetical protein
MGNLMDKYTDEEWYELGQEIEREKKLGKPNESYLAIFVDDLTKEQLVELKNKLIECNTPKHQYWRIDDWIKYRENKERVTNKTNT